MVFSFENINPASIAAKNDDGTVNCSFCFSANGKGYKLDLYEVVDYEDLGHLLATNAIYVDSNESGGYVIELTHGFAVGISFSDYELSS